MLSSSRRSSLRGRPLRPALTPLVDVVLTCRANSNRATPCRTRRETVPPRRRRPGLASQTRASSSLVQLLPTPRYHRRSLSLSLSLSLHILSADPSLPSFGTPRSARIASLSPLSLYSSCPVFLGVITSCHQLRACLCSRETTVAKPDTLARPRSRPRRARSFSSPLRPSPSPLLDRPAAEMMGLRLLSACAALLLASVAQAAAAAPAPPPDLSVRVASSSAFDLVSRYLCVPSVLSRVLLGSD